MLSSKAKEPQLLILLLLASFASVAAVLFTPALPEMTKEWEISTGVGQLAMTSFLVGYALGNLPYGPFSNRYGRKPTLYLGILVAIVGSLLILFAGRIHLYWLLIVGRFLTALGSSVGLKITFTMIGDTYSQTLATKKISYVMLTFAIAPGLAIALGGILTKQWGWESNFYFLTFYSFLLLLLSLFLPETAVELDPDALDGAKIKEGLLRKFKNKKIVACALMMGCATSVVYLFATEAPFIGIDRIGLKPDQYGVLNFIPPIGMIVGSLFANRLAGKKEILSILKLGIAISFISALAMLSLFLFGVVSTWSLFAPMPFLYVGLSLIFSNASGLAMSHAQNKSNASAVMNFINMSVAVVVLLLIGVLPNHPATLPVFFVFLSLVMLGLRFFLVEKT